MKSAWNLAVVGVAVVAACALLLAAAPAQAAGGAADGAGVVNVNSASAQQLQLLPGIGAKKAQAILEHRAKSPFGSVDELLKVKGIGQKLLERIRPQVVLQGDTTLKPALKKKGGRTKKSD
jgi:competence protein ComEA